MELKKKYGLITGIAMVVGIVIGSGVFFKADKVLMLTGGKLWVALSAWFVGGLIMVISAFSFATMATRVEKVNGVVDYVEKGSNKKIGYLVGWYLGTVYYPTITSVLGILSMDYIFALFGKSEYSGLSGGEFSTQYVFWILVIVLIVLVYVVNIIAPKISGYFQVSSTIIKLIPIAIIAIVGTIYGVINDNVSEAFSSTASSLQNVTNDFGRALLATIFAYEGWVVATSINAELKNSKKNLPRALLIGTMVVMVAYLLYYLGISLIIPSTTEIINLGSSAPIEAFGKFFKGFAKTLFTLFVIISCLGTLNGLTLGSCRGMYSLAVRDQGLQPAKYRNLHPKFNISIRSGVLAGIITSSYVLIWILSFQGKIGLGSMDELAIAFLYTLYIFIYIWIIKNVKDANVFVRYVMPILGIVCSVILTVAATGIYTLVSSKFTDFSRIVEFLQFAGLAFASTTIGLYFYSDKREKVDLIEASQE